MSGAPERCCVRVKKREGASLQNIAIGLIGFYQRRLSPYKGYRCAHREHTGGPSCSEFAKQIILARGVLAAFPLMKQRFLECRGAYIVLQRQAQMPAQEKDETPPVAKGGGICANACVNTCALPCC